MVDCGSVGPLAGISASSAGKENGSLGGEEAAQGGPEDSLGGVFVSGAVRPLHIRFATSVRRRTRLCIIGLRSACNVRRRTDRATLQI
jgi:hypothetical protein